MPAGVYTDGDFTVAVPSGNFRRSYNPTVLARVLRQQMMQDGDYWTALTLNTVLPGTDAILVEETELQDIGGGLVTWDRVWAQVPPDRQDKSSCVKTIKYLRTAYSGTTIVQAAVATQSKTVACDVNYSYSTDPAALGMPDYPDVSIETVGPFINIVATGGFNYDYTGGSNAGYHFISGDLSFYMGRIYQRRLVYA